MADTERAGQMAVRSSTGRFSRLKQWKYDLVDFPLYLMGHPFKGFSDIKLEGEGKVYVGVILLFLQAFVAVLQYFYSGFIINRHDPEDLNVLLILATSIVPILLFIVGNWSITTLMNGSGSIRDIFIVLTYSQYLTIPINLLAIVLSNILVMDEMAVVTFLTTLGWVLFAIYTFIGLVTVHDFGFLGGVGAVLLTFFAILIILFTVMLLATLSGEVLMFFRTVFRELRLNMA